MVGGTGVRRLGILVGGGPAPGINGVIAAATIEAINNGMEVFGFYEGFKYLAQGDATRYRKLCIDDVTGIHLKGGSILGTSRHNPTKVPAEMHNVLGTLRGLGIDALITIGGDDTAYSASQVYAAASGSIRVAHVPKTIDNDLPLPGSAPTFGFETARHYGVMLARNLAEDAKTTRRWYIVVSMGRAAGHLALGIGKAAAATLTIIPEEFRDQPVTVGKVCDIILGSIIKRRSMGDHYGLAILAEGLIQAIGVERLKEAVGGEEELRRYGRLERDPHGNLRLGEIAFGRLIREQLEQRLKELNLNVSMISQNLGYELRCADPIPFDAEYTRDLGYGAVRFILSEEATKFGAIISILGGAMTPLKFDEMLDPETKRMRTRKVNVDGEAYRCARSYMIRLEPADFEIPSRLARLAEVVGMTPEQFKQRFAYVAQS